MLRFYSNSGRIAAHSAFLSTKPDALILRYVRFARSRMKRWSISYSNALRTPDNEPFYDLKRDTTRALLSRY